MTNDSRLLELAPANSEQTTIQTKVHTIFLLIGPTECGKTTFANEVLIPQLRFEDEEKNFKANIQYLSSDAIRQEILGDDKDKYDPQMMESSAQAFELLFAKLKAVTSYPVNAEFVIVDTKGIAEEFREQVLAVAKENHYNVEAIVFDYKDRKDYYVSERSKKLITKDLDKLRMDTLPKLRKNKYAAIHRIRTKDFYSDKYHVEIINKKAYLSCFLPANQEYIIVGDVHEDVASLKSLILKHGFLIEDGHIQITEKTKNKKFVLVGDWIDKGGQTLEIIEFIEKNKSMFYLVLGNHENFVSKFIRGDVEKDQSLQTVIDQHFTSIKTLEQNEALQQRFLNLVSTAKPFYRYNGLRSPSFIVTHAPCQRVYLGKMDRQSTRNQMRIARPESETWEERIRFIKAEAVSNHPFHVFGHVAAKKVVRVKNKIGIDTGAVYGNELTSVELYTRYRPFYHHVSASHNENHEAASLPILFAKEKKINLDELEPQDKRRLHFILKNQINFISGTMSPSDQDAENGELESLKMGLDYYKNKGVKEVVLQPKYMGSRCNIYLSQELDRCFAVTRNGYKINRLDLTAVFEPLIERFKHKMQENGIQTLILDGELMPWSALGKGLIDNQFGVVSKAIETEVELLKQTNFDAAFGSLADHISRSGIAQDASRLTKHEMIDKWGYVAYRNYTNLQDALPTYVPIEKHEDAYEKFDEQLKIYGSDGALEFHPFSILKIIYTDGSEEIPTEKASEIFSQISNDEFLVVDLSTPDYFDVANRFYQRLTTERKMEGVVIKPEQSQDGVAPYMKVRNSDYLTLVYGYDYQFPHKFEKLMKQKDTSQKLKSSIAEFELGRKMLSHPLSSITPENESYKQVVANLMFEEKKEKELDPRL